MDRWTVSESSAATVDSALASAQAGFVEERRLPSDERWLAPLAPPLQRRRLQVYLALMVSDAIVILCAFLLAGRFYHGQWFEPLVLLEAQLVVPFYWTAAIGNHAYAIDAALRPLTGLVRAMLALLLAMAIVMFLTFYLKSTAHFSRVVTASSILLSGLGLAIVRSQLARFAAWHCGPTATNRLVINDGGRHLDLPHSFVLDARQHGLVPDLNDPHTLNRIGQVFRNMDRVVVSCPQERRKAWALVLKGAHVQGEIVDDDIRALGAVGALRDEHYAALIIATGPLRMSHRGMKRLLDLAIALPALIVLFPLLLLVALAIKLEDGGPVLFIQRRLGRGNCFFRMYKFRSMRSARGDRDGAVSTARDDARVTRIGRLIRATSIDELPQLINVVKGEMSLVGPRPHAIGSHAGAKLFWEVDDRYWERHALKPGLTGLAQVRGLRGATPHEQDLADRLQSDLEYLDGWTIWRDLAILAATLRVLVHDKAF